MSGLPHSTQCDFPFPVYPKSHMHCDLNGNLFTQSAAFSWQNVNEQGPKDIIDSTSISIFWNKHALNYLTMQKAKSQTELSQQKRITKNKQAFSQTSTEPPKSDFYSIYFLLSIIK